MVVFCGFCYEFYFFIDTINDKFSFFHTYVYSSLNILIHFIYPGIHTIFNSPLHIMGFFQPVGRSVGHQLVS